MANGPWYGSVADEFGLAIPYARINVTDPGDPESLVALYKDRDGNQPLGNPFMTGPDGVVKFYARAGRIDIYANHRGVDAQVWYDEIIADDWGVEPPAGCVAWISPCYWDNNLDPTNANWSGAYWQFDALGSGVPTDVIEHQLDVTETGEEAGWQTGMRPGTLVAAYSFVFEVTPELTPRISLYDSDGLLLGEANLPAAASGVGALIIPLEWNGFDIENIFITIYGGDNAGYVRLTSVELLHGFSRLLIPNNTGARLQILDTTGDDYNDQAFTMSTPPTGTGRCSRIFPDGSAVVIGQSGSPYINAYTIAGDVYTRLANPATLPTGNVRDIAINPAGTICAVAHDNSPFLTLYDMTTAPWSKMADPATLPAAVAYSVDFSPDGSQLAVANGGSSGQKRLTVYDTATWTIPTIGSDNGVLPGNGRVVRFHPTETMIFVGFDATPYLRIYDTTTWALYTGTGSLTLPNLPNDAQWRPTDGRFVAVGHATSPYFTIIDRNSWTTETIGAVPYGDGTGVAWSPDGTRVAVSDNGGAPQYLVYKYDPVGNDWDAIYGDFSGSFPGKPTYNKLPFYP